eukprot:scaffold2009_cov370-Prasinococcus_capsulatus_cf.AAC.4
MAGLASRGLPPTLLATMPAASQRTGGRSGYLRLRLGWECRPDHGAALPLRPSGFAMGRPAAPDRSLSPSHSPLLAPPACPGCGAMEK